MTPNVSVIMPVKDSGAYLERCIDSVILQKYSAWELLIVNDGSSDDTLDIAKKYASNDSRIKLYDSKGTGVSAARNHGISEAAGQYIGFVDSDDWLDPEYLSTLLELAVKEDACISQCSFYYSDVDGSEKINDEAFAGVYSDHDEIMNAYFSGMIGKINLASWGKLYKRELIEDIRFDEGLTVQEDAYFTFQCVMKASKIACSDRPFYYYFQNPSSTMNRPFDGSKMQYFTVLDRELEQLKGNAALEERLLDRKMTTAFDLISRIVMDDTGSRYLRRLRRIALDTSWLIRKHRRLGSKTIAKSFLLRHFPHVYYSLLKRKY